MISLEQHISKIELQTEQAYDLLYDAFINFEMPIVGVPVPAKGFVFRSRQNEGKINFCKFDDLSYPPSQYVKNFSRANKPFQQIFYASDNFKTNLAELLPYWIERFKTGDVFSVTSGQWEQNSAIHVGVVPDLLNSRLMEKITPVGRNFLTPVNLSHWNYINRFFRAQGFLDNNIYKFTSAYCNALFHNANKTGLHFDGILYTSIQDISGWNLALTPNIVDKSFVLKSVIKHFIRKGEPENGKPTYDNFIKPVQPLSLDYNTKEIKWSETDTRLPNQILKLNW